MLKTQFEAIVEWQRKTFPAATSVSKLKHLKKEIERELIPALESNAPGRPHEYADCFLLLFGSAAMDGMTWNDIVKAIEEKFLIVQHRQWKDADENGVYEHVKTETHTMQTACGEIKMDVKKVLCGCGFPRFNYPMNETNECEMCGKPIK